MQDQQSLVAALLSILAPAGGDAVHEPELRPSVAVDDYVA